MVELPEERQAAALRQVAEIGKERAELLAKAEALTEPLREAALAAASAGAGRSRIRVLAGISPKTLYGWLEAAGLEVRPKRTAKDEGDDE
jgi:hypothetical protein